MSPLNLSENLAVILSLRITSSELDWCLLFIFKNFISWIEMVEEGVGSEVEIWLKSRIENCLLVWVQDESAAKQMIISRLSLSLQMKIIVLEHGVSGALWKLQVSPDIFFVAKATLDIERHG